MNQNVRYGLIGYGAWGKHHADAITKTQGSELVAICARSDETLKIAGQDHPQAALYQDALQLLQRDDIDAIDLVLPSHLHHRVASEVLRSEKHLLLEKPMAITLEECDELIQLSREHQRLLAVGHELRLSSLWQRVKQLIDEGYVGQPQYVLVELSRRPYRQGSEGWRYDLSRVGNWILEEPIHFFDLARWYLSSCGEPTQVMALANSRQLNHPELQDNFSSLLSFNEGAYAVITQTLSAFEHHQTVKVAGTQGALWAQWSGVMDRTPHPTYSLSGAQGEQVQNFPIDKPTGELFELRDQIAMFSRAIRDDAPLACSAEDGRWAVAMCEAAQQSVMNGLPVKISQLP